MALQSSGSSSDKFAAGSSAQRPTSPVVGDVRFNSTTSCMEYWDGTAWQCIVGQNSLGDGNIKVEVTDGIKVTGDNSSANSSTDATRSLAFDEAWGDSQGWGSSKPDPHIPGNVFAGISGNNRGGTSSWSTAQSFNVASLTAMGSSKYRMTFTDEAPNDHYTVCMGWTDGVPWDGVTAKMYASSYAAAPDKDENSVVFCFGGNNRPNRASFMSCICITQS